MAIITEGIVSEIERYAIKDGPGIRTVVFLKGCPLHCLWCSNPETQQAQNQLMYWPTRCIGCGQCLAVCPAQALRRGKWGIEIDRGLCTCCGACVEGCNSEALTMAGTKRTVSEVLDIIRRDEVFYRKSGGGVTFSGGEATVQKDFLLALASAVRQSGIHTAIETCGYAPWATFEQLLPLIDLFLYDIKSLDDADHKRFTGVSNQIILENFRRLTALHANVVVRIPIIPGKNDTEQNIQQTAAFLSKTDERCPVSLLPYHRLGASKYDKLDMKYSLDEVVPPSHKQMEEIASVFRRRGFAVTIGE